MPSNTFDWRDYMQGQLEDLPEMATQATEYVQTMQQLGPSAGMHDFISPGIRESIDVQMQGMPQAEYDAARRRVTGGFQKAVGGLASKSAQAGYYAPESVAQSAAGRPAASLVNGLQQLEATRARMRREGAASAGRMLSGLYQYPAREAQAGQEAAGEQVRRQQFNRSLQRTQEEQRARLRNAYRTGGSMSGGMIGGVSGGGYY